MISSSLETGQSGKSKKRKSSSKRNRRSHSTCSSLLSASLSSFNSFLVILNKRLKGKDTKLHEKEKNTKLLSKMEKYASEHLENCIPDRDIVEKVLTKNAVSSNLHDVQRFDDFTNVLLTSQMSIQNDSPMEKLQEKI